jgi:23S rRNA pseudouridine1911/1915/1917 synthase
MRHTDDEHTFQAVFTPNPTLAAGTRLDVFWTAFLTDRDVSRARVREAIAAGKADVAGQACPKPGYKLRGGETLTLTLAEVSGQVLPDEAPLEIVYRDESLAVLDKPAGLTVHPAPGLPDGTLVNRLVHHFPGLADLPGPRPGIVHRLDKDTSGLLVVALTEAARLALAEAFAARRAGKTYLALVHGRPERDEGTIRLPIGRDPDHPTRMAVVKKGGREAVSQYKRVWTAPEDRASLLEVAIATGRTHQIRVHLAALGHPLLGDAVYGPRQQADWKRLAGGLAKLARRQMLHAWKLSFAHPVTGQAMDFSRPPPRDFWRLLLLLGRRCQRVGLVGMPGCGKSRLLDFFAAAGFPTFSADAAVAALYAPGGDGAHVLGRRYGPVALAADGSVDKVWLLGLMRESERARREVMELIHPLVRARMEVFFRENALARAAFAETPLLLEAGWDKVRDVDLVVGVGCDPAVRRLRLAARSWSPALMDEVDGWQWDEARKLARCRHVVDNSGDLAALAAGARAVLAALAGHRRATALARYARLVTLGYAGQGRSDRQPAGGPA